MSFVNVYQFLCVSFFPFGFNVGMWDLIVLISDRCLFIHFTLDILHFKTHRNSHMPFESTTSHGWDFFGNVGKFFII